MTDKEILRKKLELLRTEVQDAANSPLNKSCIALSWAEPMLGGKQEAERWRWANELR